MFTSLKFWFKTKSFIMMMISITSTYLLFMSIGKIIFHFDMNSFTEIPFTITLMIDTQSLIFISTVSTVSSIIIMYSFFYLEQETPYSLSKFLLTLLVFIMSMFILSVSANSFWLLVGWDGLGISSFCLIIFYQNWKSFGSGMVTFLSNRLGDTMIIISMMWLIMNQSSDAWMFPKHMMLLSILISAGAYSKSAQLPYLFWLPQAMAAPTPVSALVHSSTLVTAGIYLMCRFNPCSSEVSIIFFSISCITVLIAGTSSLMEFDLKKVIALSTLCHISLMMMFSVLGETNLSLFHLMTHAFFKSLLFMIAGCIIHLNCNSQDIRFISIPKTDLTISFSLMISILSMMGFPFLSGFYSKEALLMNSSISLPSILMIFMFLANSFFSCAYSTRLMTFIFSSKSKKMISSFEKNSFSTILLSGSLFSCFLGGLMMTSILPEDEYIQSSIIKMTLFLVCMLGIFTGVKVSMNSSSKILNPLTELWKSDLIYKTFQKHFFLSSSLIMWMMDDKGVSKIIYENMMKKMNSLSKLMSEFFLKEPFSFPKSIHLFFILMITMWS